MSENTTQILLIECPDQTGLVHRITGVLFHLGANVVSNHEFVDRATAHFFMRTEFSGSLDAEALLGQVRAVLPAVAGVRLTDATPRDVVVLVTREHHCLGELLLRHAHQELGARIRAIIGNHDTLAPLAGRFDVPFHHVSHVDRTREEHETAILAILDQYRPQYLVLAKYMRVLTSGFVSRYPGRIINIHHSFLPAFIGANPYQQAFDRGVKIIGATAHYVTVDLDRGPIIAQSVIPVDHTHGPGDMAQSGRDVEKLVLARALKLVFEERVFLSGNRTIIFE